MATKGSVAPVRKALWSVKELAEYLGVSLKTIWRWEETGELPRGKRLPGRAVRWDPAKIEAWFEKRPTATR